MQIIKFKIKNNELYSSKNESALPHKEGCPKAGTECCFWLLHAYLRAGNLGSIARHKHVHGCSKAARRRSMDAKT
jgi:hypothetical protein